MNNHKRLLLLALCCLAMLQTGLTQPGNCDNAGFEIGTTDGYRTYIGKLDGRGDLIIDTPGPDPERHRIMNISDGYDPIAERYCEINKFLSVVPQGAGQYAMRLGTSGSGAQAERVVLKFTVTPERAFFLLSYAVLLQDPGHEPFEQPRFELRIQDENGNTFDCGEYQVRAQENIEGFENCGIWRVRPWTTAGFELQSYMGQEVQIEILTTDCSKGGHAGYAYFDASCRPLELNLQGYCPGTTSAKLIATEGFDRYQWSTGATDNLITINNPVAGTPYAVTVTSATGCTLVLRDTLPTITELNSPSFTTVPDTTLCPGNSLWIRPAGAYLGDIFSPSLGFAADSFLLVPTETTTYVFSTQDEYGCHSDTLRHTVRVDSQSVLISIDQVEIDSTSCADLSDGRISLQSNAHQILWDNGSTSETISQLAAGSYPVRLYDRNGCFIDRSYQIKAPSPVSFGAVDIDPVSCFGDSDGGIIAVPTGGIRPYFLPGSNSPVDLVERRGLASGSYILSIVDRNGCSYSQSYTVDQPAQLLVDLLADSVRCFGESNGRIQALPSGGILPYTYNWEELSDLSVDQLSNLSVGSYMMEVQDANGCLASQMVEVGQPAALEVLEVQVDSASCHDSSDGRAWSFVGGGNGGYQYDWSAPGSPNGPLVDGLAQGGYSVTVQDRKGCNTTESFEILAPAPLLLEAMVDSVSCYDGMDGRIWLGVEGGNGGYQYHWVDSSVLTPNRSQLSAGFYEVEVLDQKNCQSSLSILVEQPDSISIAEIARSFPDCEKEQPGSVTIAVMGGNGGYQYLWETGLAGPTITSFQAASFQVQVTDRKACVQRSTAHVPGLEVGVLAEANFLDSTFAICAGENVSLSIDANHYIAESFWSSTENLPCDTCFFFDFEPISSTSYEVIAIDVKGCRDTASVFIPVEQYDAKLLVEGDFIGAQQLVCFGDEVKLSIVADPPAASIHWESAQKISCDDCPSIKSRPSDFSRYQVNVLHENGCVSELSTDVNVRRDYCQAFIPNAFSPNGDGVNDRFTVPGSRSGEWIRSLQVYDRWGMLVYRGEDIRVGTAEGWDGLIHSRPAPVATYVYMIIIEHFDGSLSRYKGDVSLIR